MSQLYLTGSYSNWDSQQAAAAFMDSNHYVIIAGHSAKDFIQAAVAIQYTGGMSGWQNEYPGEFGTSFKDITQLADGTYMAVGSYFTSQSSQDHNIWIVNIDGKGNKIWDKQIGTADVQSDGTAITATADGGFVIVGTVIKNEQIFSTVKKFSKVQSKEPKFSMDWELGEEGIAYLSIAPASNGSFILSGRKSDAGFNCNPVALLLAGNGSVMFNTTFSTFTIYALQSSEAIQTADGNFVMAAKNTILKFKENGNVIWSWVTPNGNYNSVLELPNGNLAIGGAIIANNFDQAYVAVTDSGGNNIVWDNSEVVTPSDFAQVFMDPRAGGVVWACGNAPLDNQNSEIIFASFNPVTKLMG